MGRVCVLVADLLVECVMCSIATLIIAEAVKGAVTIGNIKLDGQSTSVTSARYFD